jgi:hypothetical protein
VKSTHNQPQTNVIEFGFVCSNSVRKGNTLTHSTLHFPSKQIVTETEGERQREMLFNMLLFNFSLIKIESRQRKGERGRHREKQRERGEKGEKDGSD